MKLLTMIMMVLALSFVACNKPQVNETQVPVQDSTVVVIDASQIQDSTVTN